MAKDNYLLSYALRYPSSFLLKCREINLKREFLFPLLQRGQTSLSYSMFLIILLRTCKLRLGSTERTKATF